MKQTLEELAKEEERNYRRSWRAKNRERIREYNRRYWLRRAQREVTGKEDQSNG